MAQPLSLSGQRIDVNVGLPSRDELSLQITIEDGKIQSAQLKGRGCDQLLNLLVKWRPKFQGALSDVELPSENDHASILLRELILKAQGRWNFPYKDTELCHCRAIPTSVVDAAIVGGCHTVHSVSKATSAGTSCGTCRPDIERVPNFRLRRD